MSELERTSAPGGGLGPAAVSGRTVAHCGPNSKKRGGGETPPPSLPGTDFRLTKVLRTWNVICLRCFWETWSPTRADAVRDGREHEEGNHA